MPHAGRNRRPRYRAAQRRAHTRKAPPWSSRHACARRESPVPRNRPQRQSSACRAPRSAARYGAQYPHRQSYQPQWRCRYVRGPRGCIRRRDDSRESQGRPAPSLAPRVQADGCTPTGAQRKKDAGTGFQQQTWQASLLAKVGHDDTPLLPREESPPCHSQGESFTSSQPQAPQPGRL